MPRAKEEHKGVGPEKPCMEDFGTDAMVVELPKRPSPRDRIDIDLIRHRAATRIAAFYKSRVL